MPFPRKLQKHASSVCLVKLLGSRPLLIGRKRNLSQRHVEQKAAPLPTNRLDSKTMFFRWRGFKIPISGGGSYAMKLNDLHQRVDSQGLVWGEKASANNISSLGFWGSLRRRGVGERWSDIPKKTYRKHDIHNLQLLLWIFWEFTEKLSSVFVRSLPSLRLQVT